MRQKNHTLPALLPGLVAILVAALIITSCKKNSPKESTASNEMQVATNLLEGKLIWGQLENGGSEDNVMYLDFNHGDRAIFIQPSPDNPDIEIRSFEKAEIVTSPYGIIIKNSLNNKVLLFPQNDTESMRKFESIAPIFKEKTGSTPIAGTILLNFKS